MTSPITTPSLTPLASRSLDPTGPTGVLRRVESERPNLLPLEREGDARVFRSILEDATGAPGSNLLPLDRTDETRTLRAIPRDTDDPAGANLIPIERDAEGRVIRRPLALGSATLSEDDTPADRERKAREAAESLVSITLVQPILSQLREANQAAEPFAPTSAERQFRALQDAKLAESIVSRAQFPLVEKVARRVLELSRASGQTGNPDDARQGGPHGLERTNTEG